MTVEERCRCAFCNRQIAYQNHLGVAACPRCADEAIEFEMPQEENERVVEILQAAMRDDDSD